MMSNKQRKSKDLKRSNNHMELNTGKMARLVYSNGDKLRPLDTPIRYIDRNESDIHLS